MNDATASSSARIKRTTMPAHHVQHILIHDLCASCHYPLDQCTCREEEPTPRRDTQPEELKTKWMKVMEATPAEARFRHSHWQATREKVHQAMIEAHAGHAHQPHTDDPATHDPRDDDRETISAKAHARRIASFIECGACSNVEWSETLQRHRVKASYCKSRHCEPCMRAKAQRIRANLEKQLATLETNTHRFFTFTLAHTDDSLDAQIKKLYRCFKNLRRRKPWSDTQRGGVVMLEVKLVKPKNAFRSSGEKSAELEWHPHLHVISEGCWIDIAQVKQLWNELTGGSWCVDVRSLPRGNDVAGYVCKYVTKGTSSEVWRSTDHAIEWIHASKGVRTCATFGSWRGLKLTAPIATATDWTFVGRLDDLIRRSRNGEEVACGILTSLRPPGDEWEDQVTSQ
jgi:Replication protein